MQTQQALPSSEGPASEVAAAATDEAAAGAFASRSGTWLCHVPRAVAIDYAARALDDLSDLACADEALANEEANEAMRHIPEPWRPLWWWRRVVQLLPLLAVGKPREEEGVGVEEAEGQRPWRPIAFDHPYLTITYHDDEFTRSCRYCLRTPTLRRGTCGSCIT